MQINDFPLPRLANLKNGDHTFWNKILVAFYFVLLGVNISIFVVTVVIYSDNINTHRTSCNDYGVSFSLKGITSNGYISFLLEYPILDSTESMITKLCYR